MNGEMTAGMAEQRTDSKVCIFIDNSALHRAMMLMEKSSKVDYEELLHYLLQGRSLGNARFYCGEFKKDQEKKDAFYKALKHIGFEVSRTLVRGHRTNKRVPSFDSTLSQMIRAEIAWDMRSYLEQCDTFVLVTGDPAYTTIVNKVREQGVKVEVVFFSAHCSYELHNQASEFRELCLGEVLLSKQEMVAT